MSEQNQQQLQLTNSPTHILSQDAIALGFYHTTTTVTPATTFLDKSGVTSTLFPNEPLYYFIEQRDSNGLPLQYDPTAPKLSYLREKLRINDHHIVKSLIFEDLKSHSPCCILMHGDCSVNTRAVGKALQTKGVKQLPVEQANANSGYIVGGTSGFGLKTPMPIVIEENLLTLDWIIINGGGHYRYILIRPQYFVQIFSSQYSKDLGFSVQVAPCARVKTTRFNAEEADNRHIGEEHDEQVENLHDPQPSQQQSSQQPQLPKRNIDLFSALTQIKEELTVLTAAFDQNNITNPEITLSTPPSDYLLHIIPQPFISQLLEATKCDALTKTQPSISISHWTRLTIPQSSSLQPLSPTSTNQQQRTILLKFYGQLDPGYPFIPLSNIKLSCDELVSDFYSLFDLDQFTAALEAIAINNSTQGKEHVLDVIQCINDDYQSFFRHNLSSSTSPTNENTLTTTNNTNDVKSAPPTSTTTTSTSSTTTPLMSVPIQQFKPTTYIDPIDFCAQNEITTIHPIDVWKYFMNGTFPLHVLEDLTPVQRYTIYHTNLLGRIVKNEGRSRLYEEIVQSVNKLKDKFASTQPSSSSSTTTTPTPFLFIPTALQSQSAINNGLITTQLTLPQFIKKIYNDHHVTVPSTKTSSSALDLVNNTASILQIASPARHIDLKSGELTSFIQKKHGSVKVGLVGLPNVGKSSTFNVLSGQQVPASNFAFCTIDPNICRLPIVEKKFDTLVKSHVTAAANTTAATGNSAVTPQPPEISIVDIAGIVKDASTGKGLGNSFLHHISTVHVIYQVVRCFDDSLTLDSSIEHVENTVNPIRDIQIIDQELIDKDIEQFYRRISRLNPFGKIERFLPAADIDEKDFQLSVLLKAHSWLVLTNKPLRYCTFNERESEYLATLQTWTSKPVCIILNMSVYQYCDIHRREGLVQSLVDYFKQQNMDDINVIPISVVYEQARALCYKRYVPFIGHKVHQCEQFNNLVLTSNTVKNDHAIVPPIKSLQQSNNTKTDEIDVEMKTIAAIGREIQAIRNTFLVSTDGTNSSQTPKDDNKAPSATTTMATDGHQSKDRKNKSSKHDKGEKSDKKKDKKSSLSSKFTSAPSSFDMGGGGFADFLGFDDFAVPETTTTTSKPSKKERKSSTTTSTPSPPTTAPSTTNNTKDSKKDDQPSRLFWNEIDQYLNATPYLHSLLQHIVRDDDGGNAIILPSTNLSNLSDNDVNYLQDEGDEVNNDGNDDDYQHQEHKDSGSEHQLTSTSPSTAAATAQPSGSKGKVLFLDFNNPTPLDQIIVKACHLARVIQFFIVNKDNIGKNAKVSIRGIMIPQNTTALSASLRLSYDLFNNFHSCDVARFSDVEAVNYQLSKVKLITQNKSYLVQDGDILYFKRTKK